jgi:medium-chain acyl-[acyl-carrier-protein] hydrolase
MTVSETYTYVPETPFDFPITAYGGIQDSVFDQESLNAWRQQTLGQFRLKMFPGDHFYLQNAQADLLQDVKMTILGLLK